MLKIHVKLFSKAVLLTLRDMEVGMIYKGNKGLPKIVVHKTAKSVIVRNVSDEKTMTASLFEGAKGRQKSSGTRPMKVFAIATNNRADIDRLKAKASSV